MVNNKKLALHLLTLVRDGMPFLRWHFGQLQKIKAPWTWHLVEGLAELKHDTAWSVPNGGRLPRGRRRSSLSTDGTTEYLNHLRKSFPDRVKIYRKPAGQLWQGKVEMVQAPLASIREEGLLWQLDSDELWSAPQIQAVVDLFQRQPRRTAAYFWCNFFVGPDAVVSSRNGYSQNPGVEWLRVWRYRPGDRWASHEPPRLMRPRFGRGAVDVASLRPFSQRETEAVGAVFDHYAYATRGQVAFKESYYGYRGAVRSWERLQQALRKKTPRRLSDYFSWVTDTTSVSTAAAMGLRPIARPQKGRWTFSLRKSRPAPPPPQLLIDGVAYQDGCHYGVYRVWNSLFQEWARTGFARYVKVLDRNQSVPDLAGLSRVRMRAWSPKEPCLDRMRLGRACRKHGAEVFVSTWISGPGGTASAFLHHDFISQRMGEPTHGEAWRAKAACIRLASAHLCVSENTARDLRHYFPEIPGERIRVAHLGVDAHFSPRKPAKVQTFRRRHSITKPYFLLVGERIGQCGSTTGGRGYKNTKLFFESYRSWEKRDHYELVLVGRTPPEPELVGTLNPDNLRWLPELSEEEMACAYSGATALPYPSRYEGFGLPVLEAMACSCPVITTRLASLPEVGGEAPFYVHPDSHTEMRAAMEAVLIPAMRDQHVSRGLRQAKKFSWEAFGRIAAESFSSAAGKASPPSPAETAGLVWGAGWECVRTLVRTTKRRLRPAK